MKTLLIFLFSWSLVSCRNGQKDHPPPRADSLASGSIREQDCPSPPCDTKYLFSTPFRYEQFPAKPYSGHLAHPNLVKFWEGSEGRKQSIERQMDSVNFAGHYTIVFLGCGAMCLDIVIVDRKTGRIYDDLPVNQEGRWGFRFRKDSRLLIANSELLGNDTLSSYSRIWNIHPELYEWTGSSLKKIQ